jgi:hypothetical protein
VRARFVFALSIAMVAAITALDVGCGEVERSGKAGEASNSNGAPARAVKDRRRASRWRIPRCSASALNCRRAGGRVLYVERVDPRRGR